MNEMRPTAAASGGLAAGDQGGGIGAVPRPALAAVAHIRERRSERDLSGKDFRRFNVQCVECGGEI